MSAEVDRNGYRTIRPLPNRLAIKYRFKCEDMRDWFELSFNCKPNDGLPGHYTNFLRIRLGWLFQTYIYVPQFVKPLKLDYVSKCGEYRYPVVFAKTYGFLLTSGNFLRLMYGVQREDDHYRELVPNHCKSWFLGYKEYRHIRSSILANDRTSFLTVTSGKHLKGRDYYEQTSKAAAELEKTQTFKVRDYDGSVISGRYHIYQDEYKRGDGMWSWLSWFTKNLVMTNMELSFDSEVGSEKGSWKGGLTGVSIPIELCQSPEQALKAWAETQRAKDNQGSRHRVDVQVLEVN